MKKNAPENISPDCAKVRLIIINVVFAGGSGSDNRYLVLAIYYVWGPQPGGPWMPERRDIGGIRGIGKRPRQVLTEFIFFTINSNEN